MLLAVLFVPHPSDFAGGLRFLGLRFLDLENEDPGQTWVIENRTDSYTPLCLKVCY